MRKTFPLEIEGRHRDRTLEALKHELRKYMRRERRRPLPDGADYWDFDCRIGPTKDSAQPVHPGSLTDALDAAHREGAPAVYVELLAKPVKRLPRPPGSPDELEPPPPDPVAAVDAKDAAASPETGP